jgi:hypothetical protein
MSAVSSSSADTPVSAVGVWLVWAGREAEARAWETLLGQTPLVLLGRVSPDACSLAALKRGGDVLLVPGPLPEEASMDALRALGKGLVVAHAASATDHLAWAEGLPVVLVPASPSPEELTLAVRSAAAAARREEKLRSECEQLRQKLQDRVLVERAKGILARRLGLSEEDAYRQLRGTARRQRRTLRELAQALVDSEALLDGDKVSASAAGEDLRA